MSELALCVGAAAISHEVESDLKSRERETGHRKMDIILRPKSSYNFWKQAETCDDLCMGFRLTTQ
jgi:hypothetical protein